AGQRRHPSARPGDFRAPQAGHRGRAKSRSPAALRRGRDAQARPDRRRRHRDRRPVVGRRRPVRRPRRRRDDPRGPAHLRGHRRPGLRGQLRPGRLPRDHHRARLHGAGPAAGVSRRIRHLRAAVDHHRASAGDVDRVQRRLGPPQGRPVRGPARLRDVRRGDRPRPLRRTGGLHAAGIHGLQPGQRRARARVGGRGLRRVVHRPALADRARPRRRARRSHDHQQREPLRRPGGSPRRRAARVRDPGRRGHQRGVRAVALAAGPAARRHLLSPLARALRQTRHL
ncbi:MAG: NAD kinase, partial [uncultured Solirubrobacteraceae bacterium]